MLFGNAPVVVRFTGIGFDKFIVIEVDSLSQPKESLTITQKESALLNVCGPPLTEGSNCIKAVEVEVTL